MSAKPARIGIIGGGQLGRMFIENAARYGLEIHILEDDPHAPAAQLTHHFVEGSLKDPEAIRSLAAQCDVLTYEIEHIHADVLLELEAEGKTIIPSGRILKTIQDKGLQKSFYKANGIPTSDFKLVGSPSEWREAMLELGGERFAAKSRTGGYDGKGVFLTDLQSITIDPGIIPFEGPTMIEKFVECYKEIAVLVAVGQGGSTAVFPAVDMEFHPVSNLVTYLFTPADIDTSIEEEAQNIALKTVEALGGPGLFAIEFFLDHQKQLWVNEMAPRPHNSAHHSIEACYTSQFDQLLRVLMNWPLGSTDFHQAGIMINLTGPEVGSGDYYLEGQELALQTEGCYVHLYGKAQSKPHRKLGHITVTGPDIETAKQKAELIRDKVFIALR
jgi:5-(carboxyamino)imidazole ribonucleotide synthase